MNDLRLKSIQFYFIVRKENVDYVAELAILLDKH